MMNTKSWKAFACCAALCLALAVALATPSWARTGGKTGKGGDGVNGRNVTSVSAPPALYVLLPLGRWIEEGDDGTTYHFVEEKRDASSVYLFDASRKVRLQLDLSQKQILYSDSGSPKRQLYPIESASAEVNGGNATLVRVQDGQYRMTGPDRWVETGADGATFNFVEDNRDEWSVYLSDASRDVRLQLDLSRKQVFYSESKSPKRPLYGITGVWAVRGN
jgi:hypothetical protein